jgi:hypothetical protein
MKEESLKRANEIMDTISSLDGIWIDYFENGKVKVYTKEVSGQYLNLEASKLFTSAIEEIKLKLKTELESL